MDRFYRLTLSCPDRVGIVAAVSRYVADLGGWITEADHHADAGSGQFMMRNEIRADSLDVSVDDFRRDFEDIASEFEMNWKVTDSAASKRVVLMASRAAHCLSDILHRWSVRELPIDIACVISNHEKLRALVEWHGIPYHHVPADRSNKEPHFEEVCSIIEAAAPDAIVLARYMQIVPPDLCRRFAGRLINIHHSFLPAFVGARPYHQAHARGVKLIGATCHYVTEDLDAGPIIAQDVVQVQHRHSASDLIRLGRDVECTTLARGVRAHVEDRVLIHGNKTVVFA